MDNIVVSSDKLKSFTQNVLIRAGLKTEEAEIIADSLIYANLAGHHSHGVARLNDYLVRLENGLVTKTTTIDVVSESPATMLLDANNGWGQTVSNTAVELLIKRAKDFGCSWVGVRNSNHYGTASYWTTKIASQGLVGISMTNGSPVMVAFGSRESSLGTNPISIAIPSKSGKPVFLDMATSNQARGKINLAAKNGELIPSDWAISADGRPTTDPAEALKGALLPLGGPKGSGLAIMIDILTGVLTGAMFGKQVPRFYDDPEPQRIGHIFAAIDVEKFMPFDEFEDRMEQKEKETRESLPADGFKQVLMPGDLEHQKTQDQKQNGIVISPQICQELLNLAKRYEVAETFVD
jgi:LDH2 family malate/lactate/ureidoglycolate dehydrogenase